MKSFLFIFFLMISVSFYGQDTLAPNRFIVTAKIDTLLAKRSNCFSHTKTSFKYYHIQLYNGQSMNTARSVKGDFQTKFPEIPVVIEWESPEFKVWAGEYETKLAADQALLKIKQSYRNAFIVNPKD